MLPCWIASFVVDLFKYHRLHPHQSKDRHSIALNSPQLSRRISHLAQDSHHTKKRERQICVTKQQR